MKLLKRISWKWSLAAVLLAIPPVLGWIYLFVDGPPVDDSDLAFEPRSIRPEDNGWPILAGKLDAAYWPDFTEDEEVGEGKSRWERANRMLVEGIFDPELAREIVERNAELLEAFEGTWKLDEMRWWVGFDVTLSDTMPSMMKLRSLAEAAALRSLSWEARGDFRRALQEAMQLVRLGRKLRASARYALEFLFSRSFETLGLETIHGILRRNRSAASGLAEIGKEIISGAVRPEDVKRMVCGEYAFSREYIHQMKTGEASLEDDVFDLRGDVPSMPGIWKRRILFLPRQSLSVLSEAARSLIRDASRPMKEHEPFQAPSCAHQALGGWLWWLPVRNGVGKRGVAAWVSTVRSTQESATSSRLRCLLLGAWIAVEGHRAEHGRLPASLSELVPSRLDEAPIDPYDGEPLRYSAAKGIIYSVGSDFIDAGGSSGLDWNHALADDAEPTLRIDG